jgi:hypothetical protein
MRLEVIMAANVKFMVSWGVKSCSLVDRYRPLEKTCLPENHIVISQMNF